MAENSKLPWRLGRNGGDDTVFSGNDVVAMCDTDTNSKRDKANAAFIVRACNSFEALVAALEYCRPFVNGDTGAIDAILAKAKGETP